MVWVLLVKGAGFRHAKPPPQLLLDSDCNRTTRLPTPP